MAMDMAGPMPELQHIANPTEKQEAYFPGFVRLGEQIFYHPAILEDGPQSDSPNTSPDLIVLCSWLYALPKHIAKYTNTYRRLYPHSLILLLKQDGPDILWRPNAWQMEALEPAVQVIKSLQGSSGSVSKVLIHVFSNGGAFTACQLADAFALQSSEERSLLPISALVIDSAPSIPTIRTGYFAMSQGLPASLPKPVRLLCGVVLYSFIGVASIGGALFGGEDVISGMRRKLNDLNGAFMRKGLGRMYIYSKSDQLVPWQEVEAHADEARRAIESRDENAAVKVRMEEFQGSQHVSHVVVDADRYWRLIQDFWKEST